MGLGAEGLSYPMMPVIEVPNVRRLFAEAAEAIFDRPASKLKLIAIAGTSGKTSTSYIVAGMLAESGHPVGLVGSLGVYNGQKLLACRQTPPDAYELADLLHQMVENGCTHAIIEVSSRGIDEERIGGLKFDAVCLTNIRRDHLDIHKSVDIYRRAKMRIFDYAKPDAVVICNSDDRVTSAVLHLIQNPAMTIGMNPDTAMITGMRLGADLLHRRRQRRYSGPQQDHRQRAYLQLPDRRRAGGQLGDRYQDGRSRNRADRAYPRPFRADRLRPAVQRLRR